MEPTSPSLVKQQLSMQLNQLAHQFGMLTLQAEAVKARLMEVNRLLMAEEAKETVAVNE